VLILAGGCAAIAALGPCFDPPPGDQSSLRLRNDTDTEISVRVTGLNARDLGRVAPGGHVDDIQDAADGNIRYVIRRPDGEVGCVTPPIEACHFRRYTYAASEASPCSKAR
jgi:hypothetical protein